MPFLATGVEHKTAPLAVRERLALDAGHIATSLHLHPAVDEVAVLSTCNRIEVYLFAEDGEPALEAARQALQVDTATAAYLQHWDDLDAVRHLFRVASGLESQVLGEPQILSQVRETLERGQRDGTVGTNLHSLFRAAIRCARRARTDTRLGYTDRSMGAEAVRLADMELGGLDRRSVLLIGGGEVIRLAARELHGSGSAGLYVANRTLPVAAEIAEQFGGTPIGIADIPSVLPSVDLVIAATASSDHVLQAADVPPLDHPLLIVDLAIPRDIDPAVGFLPHVRLHDLDSLLPGGTEGQWREEVDAMEAVIAAEVQDFTSWILTRRVVPVIASLRAHVEAVSEQEMRRVATRLEGLTDREREAVESLTQRLIDKMFHHLVTRLRLAAQTDPKLVEAAEFFFLHGEGGLFEHAAEQPSETPTEQTP
jgi:glutamyl-tRNA reductase